MNALELLKSDHRTVDELFTEAESSSGSGLASLFSQIKVELETHAHIEESIFYPAIQESGDKTLIEITAEALQEHQDAKTALGELAVIQNDTDTFKALLTKLIEDVRHHVAEEEGEMFPAVENIFDEESLQNLGTQMKGEKESFLASTDSPYPQKGISN